MQVACDQVGLLSSKTENYDQHEESCCQKANLVSVDSELQRVSGPVSTAVELERYPTVENVGNHVNEDCRFNTKS